MLHQRRYASVRRRVQSMLLGKAQANLLRWCRRMSTMLHHKVVNIGEDVFMLRYGVKITGVNWAWQIGACTKIVIIFTKSVLSLCLLQNGSLARAYLWGITSQPTSVRSSGRLPLAAPLRRCQPSKMSYFNTNVLTRKYRKHIFNEHLGYCRTSANFSGSIYCLPLSLCQAM